MVVASSFKRVSVVIPAFNEGHDIAATIDRVVAALEPMADRFEVELIVVDDGSTDETARAIEMSRANHPEVRACTHDVNRGLVEALKTGARAATGDAIVYLDADLSYAPEIVEPLVTTLFERDAAVVIASPYMRGGRVGNVPTDRLVASRAANWILARCVAGRIRTFTGMVRAYQPDVLREIVGLKTHGEFNAWVVAELLRRRATIVEIPAALVWPSSRTDAPRRMTLRSLGQRLLLVLVTARTLLAAELSRRAGAASR